MNGKTRNKLKIIRLIEVGGVRHGNDQFAAGFFKRHQNIFFADLFGDQCRQCLGNIKFTGKHPICLACSLNDADNGGFIHDIHIHQYLGHYFMGAFLYAKRLFQLVLLDMALPQQMIAQMAVVDIDKTAQAFELFFLGGCLLLQVFVFLNQVILLQRQTYRQAKVFIIPGFGDELIDRSVIHRPHHSINIGIACEHYADGRRVMLFDFSKEIRTIHFGHAVVGNNHLNKLFIHDGQRFLTGVGGQQAVIFLAENAQHGL